MPRSSRRLVDPQDHGSLEDITLHPQLGVLAFEATHIDRVDPGPVGLLATGEAVLLHPVPQRAGADAEITGDLDDRSCRLTDDRHRPFPEQAIPPRAGVGLKPEHYAAILATDPDIGWFEIHAENYMGEGGAPHRYLGAIRERYPISLHGVGLSMGGSASLDREHLGRLSALIARYEPSLFSEHLAWSSHDGVYLNDLLPLPYTEETLARVCEHVDEVQETLGRRMLVENPSTYVAFADAAMSEIAFLREVVRRTGCGLLLDVNNVFVQSVNHGFDVAPSSKISPSSMWARSISAAMPSTAKMTGPRS